MFGFCVLFLVSMFMLSFGIACGSPQSLVWRDSWGIFGSALDNFAYFFGDVAKQQPCDTSQLSELQHYVWRCLANISTAFSLFLFFECCSRDFILEQFCQSLPFKRCPFRIKFRTCYRFRMKTSILKLIMHIFGGCLAMQILQESAKWFTHALRSLRVCGEIRTLRRLPPAPQHDVG